MKLINLLKDEKFIDQILLDGSEKAEKIAKKRLMI